MVEATVIEEKMIEGKMERAMQALRVEMIIPKNGELQVKGLPFNPGEKVEVIVLPLQHRRIAAVHSSLKNTIVKYEAPTQPVVEQDWEAIR
jgi:hypothetical protein